MRKVLLDVNQVEFGRFAGVTKQAVSNWERGVSVPDRHALRALARSKRISADWLTDGIGEPFLPSGIFETADMYNIDPSAQVRNELPLISWTEALSWDAARMSEAADRTLVRASRPFSSGSFALSVTGDAMEAPAGTSFPNGAIICVDPAMEAKDGSYVVIRPDGGEALTFKQLVVDAGRRYLKPLNPRYPITEIGDCAVVVGVIRQMILDFS